MILVLLLAYSGMVVTFGGGASRLIYVLIDVTYYCIAKRVGVPNGEIHLQMGRSLPF